MRNFLRQASGEVLAVFWQASMMSGFPRAAFTSGWTCPCAELRETVPTITSAVGQFVYLTRLASNACAIGREVVSSLRRAVRAESCKASVAAQPKA